MFVVVRFTSSVILVRRHSKHRVIKMRGKFRCFPAATRAIDHDGLVSFFSYSFCGSRCLPRPPFPLQVAELDEKIEGDMNREHGHAEAFAEGRIAEVEKEAARLRNSCQRMGAEVRATTERERRALDDAASLRAELIVIRNGQERTEAALAAALERAHTADSAYEGRARELAAAVEAATRVVESARQDKETLKRGIVAAQTQAAEAHAENARLLTELERVRTVSFGNTAKTVAEASAVEASEVEADTAPARTLRMRTELEDRLALAIAEAKQARAEVKLLKVKVRTCEREHTGVSVSSAADVAARSGTNRQSAGRVEDTNGVQCDRDETRSDETWILLSHACAVADRVAKTLSSAAKKIDADVVEGKPDDPRRTTRLRRGRSRIRKRGAAGAGEVGATASGYVRRRAFSVDSRSGIGNRGDTDDDADSDPLEVRSDDVGRRYLSKLEVRETLERLRFEANRLVDLGRDEREATAERLSLLQEELRKAESLVAETSARLEESREVRSLASCAPLLWLRA